MEILETSNYCVTFEDTFSFATKSSTVALSDVQLLAAQWQQREKVIVISRFVDAIHWNFIIKSIVKI